MTTKKSEDKDVIKTQPQTIAKQMTKITNLMVQLKARDEAIKQQR